MNSSSDERNPVELLAEEFLDRKRRGEKPTLGEYIERHPDLADRIRMLFPALLMMEDLGESSGGTTGSLAAITALPWASGSSGWATTGSCARSAVAAWASSTRPSRSRWAAAWRLKVLAAGALLDPKQVRRFEREAKAAARLHHTNIVPVFGVGQQDGHHYFVMQFIAGLGLDVVLEDLRRLRRAKSEAVAAAPCRLERITGLTAGDVARSLFTGRFAADGPPGDGSATEPFDDADPAASPTADGPGPTPGLPRPSCPARPSCRRRPTPTASFTAASPASASRWPKPGIRQSPGDSPSRHQAVEPAAGQPRQRLGGRLRAGQDRRGRRPDPHRRYRGHDPLHGAGAVPGAMRCPVGRVQPGPDAVRADRACGRRTRRRTGTG